MPKASPIQSSFNGGIHSPLLDGNINAPNRANAVQDSQNLIPLKQGPVVRRGGTRFVGEIQDSADDTILVRFRRNSSEAYIIEFGDLFCRFYKNNEFVTEAKFDVTGIASNVLTTATHSYADGDHIILRETVDELANDRQLVIANVTATTFTLTDIQGTAITLTNDTPSAGTTSVERIFTLASPYAKPDMFYPSGYDTNESPAIDFQQITDTLFITHPNHTMRSLQRGTNDTDWSFTTINFKDGPYEPIDASGTTITLSGLSGTGLTCTASTGIFSTTDTTGTGGTSENIDRRIRFQDQTPATNTWMWATIVGYTSATVVTVDIQEGGSVLLATAIDTWRFGLFHENGNAVPGEAQQVISAADGLNPAGITIVAHTFEVNDYIRIEDVGGMVELNGNTYKIKTVPSADTITIADVDGDNVDSTGFTTYTSGGTATLAWKNLPRNITINEDRLCFSGPLGNPERVDMTITGGYSPTILRFDPTDPAGTVTPDLAITAVIGGSEVNFVNWMRPIDRGLAVGTTGAEGLIWASNQGEALTPANIAYKQQTTNGSSFVKPFSLSSSILYVQRAGRSVHEFGYNFESDYYKSPDMSALAEHLTRGGIREMAWQQEPNNVLWVLLTTGVLLGFTYDRDEGVIAWHKHVIGGTDAKVKSIQVIPSADGSRDELWMIVQRTINSNVVQYIEYMDRYYEDNIAQVDAYHLDAGRSYAGDETTIVNITAPSPQVSIEVGSTAFPDFAIGQFYKISDVGGMTELNGNTYKIIALSGNPLFRVDIGNLNGDGVDSTDFGTHTGGGIMIRSFTTIENLQHLEGETVKVLLDGKTHAPLVVEDGAITFSNPQSGAVVQVGVNSDWFLQTLRLEAGSADGTAQGKTKRIHKIVARLKSTLGFNFGPSSDNQDTHISVGNTAINTATPLFSGDAVLEWPGGYEQGGIMYFSGDTPYPVQIQALMPQVNTQDSR